MVYNSLCMLQTQDLIFVFNYAVTYSSQYYDNSGAVAKCSRNEFLTKHYFLRLIYYPKGSYREM